MTDEQVSAGGGVVSEHPDKKAAVDPKPSLTETYKWADGDLIGDDWKRWRDEHWHPALASVLSVEGDTSE